MTRPLKLSLILIAHILWAMSFNIFAGMSLSPGTTVHAHSDANTGGGTLALGGTLSSTKVCASGFTRIGPNYCRKITISTVAEVGACGPVTLPASGAKAVEFWVQNTVTSANAVGARSAWVSFWADSGCTTTLISSFKTQVYEHAAVASGTILAEAVSVLVAPVANGSLYVNGIESGCAGALCAPQYGIAGYFD